MRNATPGVLGLGAAAMDVVLECDDLPREDGFSLVRKERVVPGGSCANVMCALVRLGTPAALIAQMGDDHYGRSFIYDLKKSGVSASRVIVKPGGTTLHTYIAVAPGGSKSILAFMGDSLLALTESQVDESMLDGVGVFYTDMLPGRPALKLAGMCKALGVPVVFNLQVGPGFMSLCGISREETREMIGLSDLFITYGDALVEISGTEDMKSALDRVVQGVEPSGGALVTLGEKGAIWRHAGEFLTRQAYNVKAEDTTGAGDAFSAGIIQSYLLDGSTRKAALAFASACAALKCTSPGPRFQGDRRAVLDFMETNKDESVEKS